MLFQEIEKKYIVKNPHFMWSSVYNMYIQMHCHFKTALDKREYVVIIRDNFY